MSWLFSQALVEEYLAGNFLDGEQSVPLNGKPIQQAYCAPDKMMDFSRLFPSGITLKPLTENHGEELLTLYREAFLAKICQLQIKKEMDLMEKEAECGEKWHASLAKYDPDLSLWKTPQCSLIEDSIECLVTFPKWGLMRNGELWAQTPLAHPTDEKEFGYLPTPTASDQFNGNTKGIEYRNKRIIRTSQTTGTEFGAKLTDFYRLINGVNLHPNFAEWVMGWPQGWTELADSKPLATDKSPCVQQQLGDC
jgi:hypothetical protein